MSLAIYCPVDRPVAWQIRDGRTNTVIGVYTSKDVARQRALRLPTAILVPVW